MFSQNIDLDDYSLGATQLPVVPLQCRTIRIGSYKYTPKDKVYISSKGFKLVAPSLRDEDKEVALQIQVKEVVRVLVHYAKSLPVIFVYTMSVCGNYIRKCLDMTDESGPYYDPAAKVNSVKRITFLPEAITEEVKDTLKKLFTKVLEELSYQEANEILMNTSAKDVNSVSRMPTRSSTASAAKSSSSTDIKQILIYPPGKGGIPINTEDYMCLAQDQFLNDVIIDFYLKHLVHDVLTASQREKTHIFSTFFYKRLTTKPSKMSRISNPHEWDSTLSPAQKRHARVRTWTKNVNIFEKDFIVVPINENCHWFVAIICFPTLEGCRSMVDNRVVNPREIKKKERKSPMQIGSTTITPMSQDQVTVSCDSDNLSERDEAEAEESDLDMQCDSEEEEGAEPKPVVEKKIEVLPLKKNEPIKQPCIIIFDSLAGASRSRVVATLRDYLTCEYHVKMYSASKKFTKDNIKGICPKIPQQNNFTDCGLYLLQYVEQFFKDPIVDYALPIKQLTNWFDEIVVTRKREEISNLLKKLILRYNPGLQIGLPDITFPTLNGKLTETETERIEEEASDGEKCSPASSSHSDDSEQPTLTLVKQTGSSEFILKRNYSDSSADSIQIRKAIQLAEPENRSLVQIKKTDNDDQIVIPLKFHKELVKDLQNTLIANKRNISDKRNSVNNQTANYVVRASECDTPYFKHRKVSKIDDSVIESKKIKKSDF